MKTDFPALTDSPVRAAVGAVQALWIWRLSGLVGRWLPEALLDALGQERPLVEPRFDQELGAGARRHAHALHLDFEAHKSLRRRVDDNGAEAERPGEIHRPFKKGDIAYGEARRHRLISSPARFA